MLGADQLGVIMLSVIMPGVVMLNVVAPSKFLSDSPSTNKRVSVEAFSAKLAPFVK
jgi:hypothetical protein